MFSEEIERFVFTKNYPTFNPKAVFFDMDGVLYDSMKSHAAAWVQALQQMQLPFSEYEAYMNEGRTGASTIDGVYTQVHGRLATEEEKQQIYRLKSTLFEAHGKTEPMPFALELLEIIKSQQLGIFIVTGSGQPTLLDSLERNFPGIFKKEKMVTAFDVKYGKPNPEPYLMALKKSGLNPWEVLVVENAPLGVESATAAGLFTVAVNTGPLNPKVLSDSGANIVLDDVKDLFDKWRSIVNN
jgi:haloacid dehalogenase superfamily, subfamily IA, variant 3 with third motif having DD or ED